MHKCSTNGCHHQIWMDNPSTFCDDCLDCHDRAHKIGSSHNLSYEQLSVYVPYVTSRFPGADDAYLTEWAERFAAGIEWSKSDVVGQALLRKLSAKYAAR